jgi:hypothetical protein
MAHPFTTGKTISTSLCPKGQKLLNTVGIVLSNSRRFYEGERELDKTNRPI